MEDISLKNIFVGVFPMLFKFILELWWFWLLLIGIYLGVAFLEALVIKARNGQGNKKIATVVDFFSNEKTERCPNCEGVLRERKGRFGRFYGCSNYPDCKYTKPIK